MTLTLSRSDHADLLARAHKALEAVTLPDHQLLAELSAAREAFATLPVPWPVTVSIGLVEHRHGHNLYLAYERMALNRELAEYCRECWSETNDPRAPATLDDDGVIKAYFEGHDRESLTLELATLEPAVPGGTTGNGSSLERGRYCVLSTAHLTSATGDLLDLWASWPPTQRPLDIAAAVHGWFVPTRPVAAEQAALLPEDLSALMEFGRVRDFDYVLVDCDGDDVEELRTHSW